MYGQGKRVGLHEGLAVLLLTQRGAGQVDTWPSLVSKSVARIPEPRVQRTERLQ